MMEREKEKKQNGEAEPRETGGGGAETVQNATLSPVNDIERRKKPNRS